MKKIKVIIPSWSNLNIDMQAETGVTLPIDIKLGGVPLYRHILNKYWAIKEQAEFVFVVPENYNQEEINKISDYSIEIVKIMYSSNIAETVISALKGMEEGWEVIVHMADTIIQDLNFEIENFIYVTNRNDIYRWTSIERNKNGNIEILQDRKEITDNKSSTICVGVFKFSNGLYIKKLLEECAAKDRFISDPFFNAIELYSKFHLINLIETNNWFDCGHLDTLYEARLKYHNLRHFNSLIYDAQNAKVTKKSENKEAFRHQVRWFKQLPDELSSFLPRIYESSDGISPFITMELLSLPTLGDLFLNSSIDLGSWSNVVTKINYINNVFSKYKFISNLNESLAREIYVVKTVKRIKEFIEKKPKAIDYKIEHCNEKISLNDVMNTIEDYVKKLSLLKLDKLVPIHGDFCFSNLLYDKRARHIKLIDPRGEFGIPGIYGDCRYDKAKLMHSYSGLYEFITADKFNLEVIDDNILKCNFEKSEYHEKVKSIFNLSLFKDEQEFQECEAIQALLFLSMLPLHSDKPLRQLAMLHNGLILYSKNYNLIKK
jgi:hypothetical protein